MRALLFAIALAGFAATPAVAQSTIPADQPPAKVKTVKKVVCERVEEERSTGSRLSATTKVCKAVEVPVEQSDSASKEGASANPHAY